MKKVLGLDISTSVVGVSIVTEDDAGVLIPLVLDHINLGKLDTFWDKVDYVKQYLTDQLKTDEAANITNVAVEEALIGFQTGMSSAQTITTLVAFNACVRLVLRDLHKMEPQCIPASSARKLAGVKVQRKDKSGGKNAKEQVFAYMCENDLSHVNWPKKKPSKKTPDPKIVDWAKDVTDAYVIAKACCLM